MTLASMHTRLRSLPGRTVRRIRSVAEDLRVLGRSLSLVLAAAPAAAGTYVAVMTIVSVLPVAQVWLTKRLVDSLAERGDSDPSAVLLASLFALTLALAAGAGPLQQMMAIWLQDHSVAEIDRRLMYAGTRLADLYRIERPAFADELRSLQMMHYLPLALMTSVLQRGLGIVLTLSGLLLLLAGLHPLIPVAFALLSIPHLAVADRLGRLRYATMVQHSRPAREMDYCARITTEPAAAKELRVFNLGGFFLQRFQDRFKAAFAEINALRFRELRIFSSFTALHVLALVGGFWYVAAQASAGRLTLGDVALYLTAVAQVERLLLPFSQSFAIIYEALMSARMFFPFLDSARPSIALPPGGRGKPAPTVFQTGIELRQLRFRYPESTADVLAEVSASLPAGQVTALVGANGAGKSTLVKLLTRMYDPDAGEVLLDGAPLAAYGLESLRQRIAVVHQDFAQFALTLRQNIAVGAFASGGADGGVEQAAAWAGADAVAAKLPQGYETELTRRFQGGVELSGGEWQKVALARGFVRDAALVILDEPTAALDAEAEYQLFQRFRELVAGKTALLISHRFSTVRMADHILVLETGRIIEAGSHDELIAQGGRYATLYEMQAGRYR